MLLSEQLERLVALETYVGNFERGERAHRDFWMGFSEVAGTLSDAAFAEDANAEVRERYCDLLARADDIGYAVPDEASITKRDGA